jgi:hypothetical protein
MPTAQCLILISTSDGNLSLTCGLPMSKDGRRSISATKAKRSQLLNAVTIRNQLVQLSERLSIRIAIKAEAVDILLFLFNSKENKGKQIGKELGLLNQDTCSGLKLCTH